LRGGETVLIATKEKDERTKQENNSRKGKGEIVAIILYSVSGD